MADITQKRGVARRRGADAQPFLATSGDGIAKCPSGIQGLDEVTMGGLPRGRPTLVCGAAGCGKTLMAMEFIARGITDYDEPGVFMSFEERSEELVENVKSLGFDLNDLIARKKLAMDHVRVERSEIEETGEYDLEGLFVRLAYAIDSVKARRVVLDTVETLFAGLSNEAIVRAELRRLFGWLKERGVTAIITGEKGEGTLTRHGIEEYVSDCVILLDHRVHDQLSTRRLRVVKYRGSSHGTNEYPFIITQRGISVLPITSLSLEHDVSNERISTGIDRLDAMLGGQGYYRGSSILISGTAGTGKTSLAGHFARAVCQEGGRCLYMAFEESPQQIMRNLRSIGVDLEPHVTKGLLRFHASRPTLHGLERHLVTAHEVVEDFQPAAVVIDPVTNLINAGETLDVHSMLMRLMDYLKLKGITVVMTSLTGGEAASLEQTTVQISSLIDTWILLRDIESGGERNRGLYVLKSRGMAHSNQIREFRFTENGIELLDVYLGPEGVLTGSARLAQEARERAEQATREEELQRRQAQAQARRKAVEAQIAALQVELAVQDQEASRLKNLEEARQTQLEADRRAMAESRRSDSLAADAGNDPGDDNHEKEIFSDFQHK